MIIGKARFLKCILSMLDHLNFMSDINNLRSTLHLDKVIVVDVNST